MQLGFLKNPSFYVLSISFIRHDQSNIYELQFYPTTWSKTLLSILFNAWGIWLMGIGTIPSALGAQACVDAWGLSRQYSGAIVKLISFVSYFSGIAVICCLSYVLKLCFIYFVCFLGCFGW